MSIKQFIYINDKRRKAWLNEHFCYEFSMLRMAKQLLKGELLVFVRTNKPILAGNIALEIFLVHARNLIEFFYVTYCKYPDGAYAFQYVPHFHQQTLLKRKKKFLFETSLRKMHKYLAHLSYSRPSGRSLAKRWHTQKIYKNIELIVKLFITLLPPKYVGKELNLLMTELSLPNNPPLQKGSPSILSKDKIK